MSWNLKAAGTKERVKEIVAAEVEAKKEIVAAEVKAVKEEIGADKDPKTNK